MPSILEQVIFCKAAIDNDKIFKETCLERITAI